MFIMESCVGDTFERIANEANKLIRMTKKDRWGRARFSLRLGSSFLGSCRSTRLARVAR